MALWDELPSALRDSGELDGLRPLLDGLTGTGPVETTEPDGTWSTYTATQDLTGPLALDPSAAPAARRAPRSSSRTPG